MQSEKYLAGTPKDWLQYANSDLELARISPPPKVLLQGLCFHAQQAAEKALKAVLVFHSVPFPKTHSIRMLLDLIPHNITLPKEIDDAAILTDYAVISSYPGDIEPVEQEEYHEAIRLAETVVSWAENAIYKYNLH